LQRDLFESVTFGSFVLESSFSLLFSFIIVLSGLLNGDIGSSDTNLRTQITDVLCVDYFVVCFFLSLSLSYFAWASILYVVVLETRGQ
jgi:hypothetical protein